MHANHFSAVPGLPVLRISRRRLLQAVGAACVVPPAFAQDGYPSKSINLIVPFAAGGTTDVVVRAIVQLMSPKLGKPIVIETAPGAGATLGAATAAGSAPDGYTVLLMSTAHTINPALYSKPGYSQDSFAPVGSIGASPCWLFVGEKSPFKTVQELVAALKANPGKYSYGSGGSGTTAHLAVELLKRRYGLHATHIPYKSAPQAFTDIIAGTVDFGMNPVTGTDALVKSGRLRALAIGSDARLPAFADVPTLTEAGLPGVDVLGWFGLVVPKGTHAPIVATLEAALKQAASDPGVRASLAGMGTLARPSSKEEFGKFIQAETGRWSELVAAIGAKAD